MAASLYLRPLTAFHVGPLVLVFGGLYGTSANAEPAETPEQPPKAEATENHNAHKAIEFNRDIRPILSDNCFACHGPGEQQSGVRLDNFEDATDWVIVPGDVESSEIISRITSDDPDLRMPPPESKKPALKAEDVEKLKRWIESGAEYQPHWAYMETKDVQPPKVKQESWVRNPIDRFVLEKLDSLGVAPSPEADRATLVRRLYLDIIGLPPTPEQVDAFLLDNRGDAYERLVDSLLASPRYAERMATWWFDLVRFANTVGYHGDQVHRVTPYRDYVLMAFRDNMPFDQFTIEQLAGDLLPEPTMWQQVATGYNRILMTSHEGGIQDKEYRAKMMADRVRNVSETWMGSSMGCCQCHDHKYDPFSIKDFYAMGAFFADVDEYGSFVSVSRNNNPTSRPPEMMAWTLPLYEEIQELDKKIAEQEAKLVGRIPENYKPLQEELVKLRQKRLELEAQFIPTVVTSAVKPPITRVLARGDWMDDTGEIVEPHVPEFLDNTGKDNTEKTDGQLQTRLDLAKWLVADDNPLTARVTANRLWRLYFGGGISKVLIDVGSQGAPPSHPELLDWLAVEFRTNGWDIKKLIRTMVTSSTYRQSSLPRPELQEQDPENRLLARQGRYRLDAEQIRDLILQTSGLLVHKLGGDFSKPYQPANYYAQLNFPERKYKHSENSNQYRRGVYAHWQRQYLHPWLMAFDAPSREECTASRATSNTPGAALVLLNDPTFLEAARSLAGRVLTEQKQSSTEAPFSDEQLMRWTWRQVTSRVPSSEETAPLLQLLEKHREYYADKPEEAKQLTSAGMAPRPEVDNTELAAWTSVCRVLLNLNETITRN